MKRIIYFMAASVLAAAVGRPTPVQAQNLSIEGYGNWKAASTDLTRAIQRHDRKAYQDCLPLQTLPVNLNTAGEYRLVTTHAKCHNGVAPPVWVVALGEKPRVMLSDGGFNVDVGAAASGFPELRVQYGNAGYCGIRVWQYSQSKARYFQKQTLRCV